MTAADQRNSAFCAGCQRYVPLEDGRYVTHGPGLDGSMPCSRSRQKVPQVLVEAEPLRIASLVIDRARQLTEAQNLLRELSTTFSAAVAQPEDYAILKAVRAWLQIHGVSTGGAA